MKPAMPELRTGNLDVAPEEEAYLRRAFRRFALPYVAISVLLALAIYGWVIARDEAGPPALVPAVDTSIADELRTEVLALRAQLAQVLDRLNAVGEEAGGAARRVSELEKRVERATRGNDELRLRDLAALSQRLDEATQRIAAVEARESEVDGASVAGASDDVDATLAGVAERVYNVEARQEEEEAQLRAFQTNLLDRVHNLETSRDRSGQQGVDLEKSMLERLDNLEGRFHELERTVMANGPERPPPAATTP
jgi:chromosome segregation ATPase